MQITFKALHYFLTAVDRRSITRAAEELHIVPSAVSAAIDSVEREFGLKLLTRYPSKGIQPTATGQILMGKIRHLLEEYNNLMTEGGDLRTALSGTLHIGYYAPVAPAFMPKIIAPLVQGNPAVSVKFTECNNETAQEGLLNGQFDAILFVAENVKPGISYDVLLELPPYVLAARDHALAGHKTLRLENLADHPLILLDLPVVGEYYRMIFEQAGIEPRVAATATSTEMIRSLVAAGLGYSILSMCPLTDISYGGEQLVTIPIRPKIKPFRFVLGHLRDNQRRLVRAFVDQCRSYFEGDAAQKLIVTA
jgi:DNA-binding transcriptional LysR family regulator